MREVRDVAASVHARLLAKARERREDFNLTLQRYAAERFLYRLGESAHREKFILKGAMLLPLWGGGLYRATRDVDLTGYAENDVGTIVAMMRDICAEPCAEDGLIFQPESVRADPIRDHDEYHGFRVRLSARLGNARLALQVDVGFGDAVVPPATEADYPTLLDAPPPRIRVYPREAVIAEKLHAMVVLGAPNTRYKDFHDVVLLSRDFAFSGATLAHAVAATFRRRGTEWPAGMPIALTPAFYADARRQAEWQRFLERSGSDLSTDFALIGDRLMAFVGRIWAAVAANDVVAADWTPGSGWAERSE